MRDDDTQIPGQAPRLTEADRTSETRFGPRPVPEGHRTASPYPHRPMRSSRIIPSAPMSPDGRRGYPAPSLSARIILWGGVALGVAGVTAGAVLATRKLAGAIADAPARPAPAARAGMAAANPQTPPVARQPVAGTSPRAPRGNVARELTATANDLSTSLDGVARSLVGAFMGFRQVASHANHILREFSDTADQVRSFLKPAPATHRVADPVADPATDPGVDPGTDAASTPRDDEARTYHRL